MKLLVLVSDFVVNSRLKILNSISVESMECPNEDAQKVKRKKNDTFCTLC